MKSYDYATLFAACPVGLIAWNRDGTIEDWNAAAERIFGWSACEAMAQPSAQFLFSSSLQDHAAHPIAGPIRESRSDFTPSSPLDTLDHARPAEPETRNAEPTPAHPARDTTTPFSAEIVDENLTKDGRTIVCEWRYQPVSCPDEPLVGLISTVQDITERARSEQSILKAYAEIEAGHFEIQMINEELQNSIQRASELTVRAEVSAHASSVILSSIPSILISLDEDGIVTAWNLAAERMFSISSGDIVGRMLSDADIDWDWPRVHASIEQLERKMETIRLEDMRFTNQSGQEIILGFTLNPMVNVTNGRAGCLLLGADVTARKRMETQLAHAQRVESIGHLAAGIAHEINTPLQYVGDNTRFLIDCFEDIDRVCRCCSDLVTSTRSGTALSAKIDQAEQIVRAADLDYVLEEAPRALRQSLEGIERVSGIVRAMKEFSHPGTSDKVATDINHAIESTLTVARNEWKYVAEIVTEFDPNLPLVRCLPGDFNQVILNMLVNAAHAIAEAAGSSGNAKGTITITTGTEGPWALIRIRDTGAGIHPDNVRRLFDPFFTTKDVGKGTGQGLAISHSIIVDKHAGKIEVESAPGEGASFSIYLPLFAKSAPESLAA